MKPSVIKRSAQHTATLARVEEIFDARPGTAKGDELDATFASRRASDSFAR
jgi:hypothetical protein